MVRSILIGFASAAACVLVLAPIAATGKFEAAAGVMPVAGLVAGFGVPIWLSVRRRAKRAASSHRMATELVAWANKVNTARAFELVRPSRVMLEAGEFAVLADRCSIIEMVASRSTNLIGTRLGQRIYTGTATQDGPSWKTTDAGEAVMTNRRIAFVGGTRQLSMTWSEIVALEALLDAVKISADTRGTAVMFTVANAPLWALAGRLLHRLRPDTNALPPGEQVVPTE